MQTSISFSNKLPSNGRGVLTTRVLFVDDDQNTTDLFKIVLSSSEFEVLTASSGPDGIEMARQFSPDVMVVDLLMPEMDGLMVCKEMRKFSNVPIIILSAVSRPGIVEQALDEGADDYLTKPMNRNLLVASINRLARRARVEQVSSTNYS